MTPAADARGRPSTAGRVVGERLSACGRARVGAHRVRLQEKGGGRVHREQRCLPACGHADAGPHASDAGAATTRTTTRTGHTRVACSEGYSGLARRGERVRLKARRRALQPTVQRLLQRRHETAPSAAGRKRCSWTAHALASAAAACAPAATRWWRTRRARRARTPPTASPASSPRTRAPRRRAAAHAAQRLAPRAAAREQLRPLPLRRRPPAPLAHRLPSRRSRRPGPQRGAATAPRGSAARAARTDRGRRVPARANRQNKARAASRPQL